MPIIVPQGNSENTRASHFANLISRNHDALVFRSQNLSVRAGNKQNEYQKQDSLHFGPVRSQVSNSYKLCCARASKNSTGTLHNFNPYRPGHREEGEALESGRRSGAEDAKRPGGEARTLAKFATLGGGDRAKRGAPQLARPYPQL